MIMYSSQFFILNFQFEPLLIQTIHWFTRHGKYERDETMCLLEAIFKGMCDEQNSSLRDVSANYFREFFAWSIKQTPKDLPVRALNHPRYDAINVLHSTLNAQETSRIKKRILNFNRPPQPKSKDFINLKQ